MSTDRCIFTITCGSRMGERCDNIAIQDGYCKECLRKKVVQDRLRGRCQYVFSKGQKAGERCENTAEQGGFCRQCLQKRSVQTRCQYIFTKGVKKDQRCPNESSEHGYCQDCLKKKGVIALLQEEESEIVYISSEQVRCELCHSDRIYPVHITGPGHSFVEDFDPEDGFLERSLCVRCGHVSGPWPLPKKEKQCIHVVPRGRNQGKRCPGKAICQGYCMDCIDVSIIREQIREDLGLTDE